MDEFLKWIKEPSTIRGGYTLLTLFLANKLNLTLDEWTSLMAFGISFIEIFRRETKSED